MYWRLDQVKRIVTSACRGKSRERKLSMLQRCITRYGAMVAQLDNIHISTGNAKTGDTAAYSLLPVITCSQYAYRTCANGACYALKPMRYNSVVWAWYVNTCLTLYAPHKVELQLIRYIRDNNVAILRLHVAGDFCTPQYVRVMHSVAAHCPACTIYTYTKSIDLLVSYYQRGGKPMVNLIIKISDWPGEDIRALYPDISKACGIAYVDDGQVGYIPKNAYRCKGTGKKDDPNTCATCGYMCSKPAISVVFPIH